MQKNLATEFDMNKNEQRSQIRNMTNIIENPELIPLLI